jgi:hypothetical protein
MADTRTDLDGTTSPSGDRNVDGVKDRHNRNLSSEYWEQWARRWAREHLPDPVERRQFIDTDPKVRT